MLSEWLTLDREWAMNVGCALGCLMYLLIKSDVVKNSLTGYMNVYVPLQTNAACVVWET